MLPLMWLRLGAAIVVAAAIAFACWWVVDRLEERGRAEIRAEWAAAKEAQRQVDAAERDRLQRQYKEAADAAKEQATRDRAAAARARAAGDELQRDFAAAVARCRAAIPAAGSEAAGADPAVLADVFGRLREAGAELAAEADRRGRAGRTCERTSDALTP